MYVCMYVCTSRFLVPRAMRSAVGRRAFPVGGPKTCNALPEDVTSSQFKYTFCGQLKTWLFQEFFSGHHHLIMTAS